MRSARVYRHSDSKQTLFAGLEAPEVFGLLSLFGVLMIVQRDRFFFDIAITGVAFLAVHLAKRGKPPGYTTALARFTIRSVSGRSHLSAAEADLPGRANPFPFPTPPTSTQPHHPKDQP